MAGQREAPWCVVFLVVGALTAHTMVLLGNLSTARMLHGMGASTNGWSVVGTDLARALTEDLEPKMLRVSSYLTEAIEVTTRIQKSTDEVLSISGEGTENALARLDKKSVDSHEKAEEFKAELMETLRKTAGELLTDLNPAVEQLVQKMRPALDQVQEWLSTFGAKIQAALEQIGTTIDKVQKIFDQVMTKLSPTTGKNRDYMVANTFTLFDTDNSGALFATDLTNVAKIFGVSALQGAKAGELVETYDKENDGLDEDEFVEFVSDPSLPGIMSVVLRTYSRKLSEIGGQLKGAKLRDEVAVAVVEYFSVVCSKNKSRVAWVSQALTNGSLPLQFTADVMKELVHAEHDPNRLSVVNVGATVLTDMVRLDQDYVSKALTLLGNASFWDSEGFDIVDMPRVLAQLAEWLANIPDDNGLKVLQKALGLDDLGNDKDSVKISAYRYGKAQSDRYQADHSDAMAGDQSALFASQAAQVLRDALLGGTGAAAAGNDPNAEQSVRRGRRARPETLEFAEWLAYNATDTAHRHLKACFDFMGASSGAVESFATQVNTMVTKTKSFLNLLSSYASQSSIDRFADEAEHFGEEAVKDVLQVCEDYIDMRIASFECEMLDNVPCNTTLASPQWLKERAKGWSQVLSGAFSFVTLTVGELKSVLPIVINDLKFAKKGLSSVANTLDSVMTVLGLKAPPLFYKIASLYRAVWISYFVFFTIATIAVLFYGFWASGYFHGPEAPPEEEQFYQAPQTIRDKLCACWTACGGCFAGCRDSHLFFWSMILLAEHLVLVLFLISVVICIVSGVQAFLTAGCSQVYILGDETICTAAMEVLRTFLRSFGAGDSVKDLCMKQQLVTCKMVTDEALHSLVMSIIGAVVASLLSLQMVVESAILHERARYRRRAEKAK